MARLTEQEYKKLNEDIDALDSGDFDDWIPLFKRAGVGRYLLAEVFPEQSQRIPLDDLKRLCKKCAAINHLFNPSVSYTVSQPWHLKALYSADPILEKTFNEEGIQPIHLQLFAGHKNLELPAENISDNGNRTFLFYAVLSGNRNLVEKVLNKFPALLNEQEYVSGSTALHYSVYASHPDITAMLLLKKADATKKNLEGSRFLDAHKKQDDDNMKPVFTDVFAYQDKLSDEAVEFFSRYKKEFYEELMRLHGKNRFDLEKAIAVDANGRPANLMSQIFHKKRGKSSVIETVQKIRKARNLLRAAELFDDLTEGRDLDSKEMEQVIQEAGSLKDELFSVLEAKVNQLVAKGDELSEWKACKLLWSAIPKRLKQSEKELKLPQESEGVLETEFFDRGESNLSKAFGVKRPFWTGPGKHISRRVVDLYIYRQALLDAEQRQQAKKGKRAQPKSRS